jgi:hypothetical protein
MSVVRIMVYGYMTLDTAISGPKPWDSLFEQPPKETKTTTYETRLKSKLTLKFLYKKILKWLQAVSISLIFQTMGEKRIECRSAQGEPRCYMSTDGRTDKHSDTISVAASVLCCWLISPAIKCIWVFR